MLITRQHVLTAAQDALSATRAAIKEGMVPGSGVALLNATEALKIWM